MLANLMKTTSSSQMHKGIPKFRNEYMNFDLYFLIVHEPNLDYN